VLAQPSSTYAPDCHCSNLVPSETSIQIWYQIIQCHDPVPMATDCSSPVPTTFLLFRFDTIYRISPVTIRYQYRKQNIPSLALDRDQDNCWMFVESLKLEQGYAKLVWFYFILIHFVS
jgi:hypothetical protein